MAAVVVTWIRLVDVVFTSCQTRVPEFVARAQPRKVPAFRRLEKTDSFPLDAVLNQADTENASVWANWRATTSPIATYSFTPSMTATCREKDPPGPASPHLQ